MVAALSKACVLAWSCRSPPGYLSSNSQIPPEQLHQSGIRQAFPNRKPPALFLEGHKREPLDDTEIDLSETVGWFTTLHPLQIPGQVTGTSITMVKFIKDVCRGVPGKGRPYFACRYQTAVGRKEFTNVQLYWH